MRRVGGTMVRTATDGCLEQKMSLFSVFVRVVQAKWRRRCLAKNNCRAYWLWTDMQVTIAPCKIQYCYAHLLRHIQDLEKEFPDNEEIKTFAHSAAPLLAEAMNLRSLPISNDEYYQQAAKTKEDIIKTMNSEANHFGIQKIQNIFRENSHRLYHWPDSRDVPADNNFAERELRPLVMARKISLGSHSDAGLKTREILMTVLKTLKLRTKKDLRTVFANFPDQLAENPNIDIYHVLFGK